MDTYIIISRASLTNANKIKEELNELIAATAKKVLDLKNDTTTIEKEVRNTTTTSTENAIDDATLYLTLHNSKLLQKIETGFAENMQLMEDEKDEKKKYRKLLMIVLQIHLPKR